MSVKLGIYKLNNGKYSFCINNFSSLDGYKINTYIKPYYTTAWLAYKEAKRYYSMFPSQITVLSEITTGTEEKDVVNSEVSFADMIDEHYNILYDNLKEKSQGLTMEDEDMRKITYTEIKSIVNVLLKIKDQINEKNEDVNDKFIDDLLVKFSSLTKKHFHDLLQDDFNKIEKENDDKNADTDFENTELGEPNDIQDNIESQNVSSEQSLLQPQVSKSLDSIPDEKIKAETMKKKVLQKMSKKYNNIENDILDKYCDNICEALKDKFHGVMALVKDNSIIVKDDEEEILKIKINDKLLVYGIVPLNKVKKICPLHSVYFYQRYWKPIVESLKHFYIKSEKEYIIMADNELPDIPSSFPCTKEISVVDCYTEDYKNIKIIFNGDNVDNAVWVLKTKDNIVEASSKYTEEDFIDSKGTLARCIDKNLSLIYGKTGFIVKVIPYDSHVEYDIDFGNQIIRLKEEKIDIVAN